MTWKDILKFKIKSPQDVKRLGNEYAAEDMYEAKVIDSDKYNLLSDVEKTKYHSSLYTFLRNYGHESKELGENRQFHYTMSVRLRRGSNRPTYNRLSNAPLGWKRRQVPKPKKAKPKKEKKKRGRQPFSQSHIKIEPISYLIIDYFKMWEKKYNRQPTLEEIKDEEGRPLTSDEENSYYRYKKTGN